MKCKVLYQNFVNLKSNINWCLDNLLCGGNSNPFAARNSAL